MDMWKPFINAVLASVPGGANKICFDKFHVASHLGDAVEQVRKSEHRELTAEGDMTLVNTKYLWLKNPDNMKRDHWKGFEVLRKSSTEDRPRLGDQGDRDEAVALPIADVGREGVEGVDPLGATQQARADAESRPHGRSPISRGILNAIVTGATNAAAESINAKIQRMKRMACGFRNRARFRNAIYFHLGGLDLLPGNASEVTHTNS